ncbi:hypothetical protein ACFPYI_00980 [Halomarina salina]|uniref:DUF8097 domain-containing protein n=1 Tax=Halomarina salina TaxID=1872699 RepID=A0ABD5RHR4_9EURY|nr:hypothetical protein [Halomarina salina]
MSRRRQALLEFAGAVLALAATERFRRWLPEDERPPRSPRWLAIGAITGIGYCWLNDTDRGGIRTNRRRGIAVSLLFAAVRFGLFRDRPDARSEFSTGRSVGTVLYRLRYGVLGALPGSDD